MLAEHFLCPLKHGRREYGTSDLHGTESLEIGHFTCNFFFSEFPIVWQGVIVRTRLYATSLNLSEVSWARSPYTDSSWLLAREIITGNLLAHP